MSLEYGMWEEMPSAIGGQYVHQIYTRRSNEQEGITFCGLHLVVFVACVGFGRAFGETFFEGWKPNVRRNFGDD